MSLQLGMISWEAGWYSQTLILTRCALHFATIVSYHLSVHVEIIKELMFKPQKFDKNCKTMHGYAAVHLKLGFVLKEPMICAYLLQTINFWMLPFCQCIICVFFKRLVLLFRYYSIVSICLCGYVLCIIICTASLSSFSYHCPKLRTILDYLLELCIA